MKYFKANIIAGLSAALCAAVVMVAPAAHAQAQTALAQTCTIDASAIAEITAIQNDPTLSAQEEVQKELAARVALVKQTIACAQNELQTLQAEVKAAPATDGSTQLQAQFADKFNDASNFYTLELGKLDNAGIAGTESIAKEVLAWRQGAYVSLQGQVNNFVLWSQNQVLFRTAQSRMNQTQRAVSFIESASGNADLQSAFGGAQTSFQAAQDENAAARVALGQFSSPDQALASIQQSLQSLSDTYQKLFDVSTLISTLLPQSQ